MAAPHSIAPAPRLSAFERIRGAAVATVAVSLLAGAAGAQTVRSGIRVVASTERDGFASLSPYPSVNNNGDVAFIGRTLDSEGRPLENIYAVRQGETLPRALMNSIFMYPTTDNPTTQTFGPRLNINDAGQVLVRRRHDVVVQVGGIFGEILTAPLTYLERWDAASTSLPTLVQMGDGGACVASGLIAFLNPVTAGVYPSPFDYGTPFAGLFAEAGFNNLNHVILSGIGNCRRNNGDRIVETFTPSRDSAALLGSFQVPVPQMADDGWSVMRLGTTANGASIRAVPRTVLPTTTIAGPANGFTSVGQAPGISDDGTAVGFAGVLDGRPGVWLAFRSGTSFATPVRIAGISGNGVLEPGEIFLDGNNNGVLDPGEDHGLIGAFDQDTRVSVNLAEPGSAQYAAVIVGMDTAGQRAAFRVLVDPAAPGGPTVVQQSVLLAAGDTVAGLSGTVTEVSIDDAAGAGGHVVLWAATGTSQAVLLCGAPEVADFGDSHFYGVVHDPVRTLWQGGKDARGAAADGVSTLLLRSPLFADGGSVRFTLLDEHNQPAGSAPFYGTLFDPLNPSATGPMLSTAALQHPDSPGSWRGVVCYRAPLEFVRPGAGDEERGRQLPRRVLVRIERLVPEGEPEPLGVASLEVHRPPVVLIHGLEDHPDSWSWSLVGDERFLVHRANYFTTHSARFATNLYVPKSAADQALAALRAEGIAATQVDAVGHSMGGLLIRQWLADPFYRRAENFWSGDFHKVVTVNTPHRGSEISYLVVNQDGSPTPYYQTFGRFADWYVGRCTPCGAVADLRPDSAAIARLNASPLQVPVHAIYGTGGTEASGHEYTQRTATMILPCATSGIPNPLFWFFLGSGGLNDAVVGVESQKAGLDALDIRYVTRISGAEGLHYPIINDYPDGAANTAVINLLNAQTAAHSPLQSSPFADGLPAWQGPPPLPPPCLFNDPFMFLDAFPVAQPQAYSSVEPGTSLVVTPGLILHPGPWTLNYSLAGATGTAPTVDQPFMVQVPERAAGPVLLVLRASRDGSGDYLYAEVPLLVVPPGPPERLDVDARIIMRNYQPRSRLLVMGEYTGGVRRNVGFAELGTTFSSSDPDVVQVDADGELTARRVGVSTITVVHGGRTALAEVVVESVKGDANQDGVVDALDVQQFVACLSGPDVPVTDAPCAFAFDFDIDGDIDCSDWEALSTAWTDPSTPVPPLAACGCPPDFDGDGTVNSNDISAFLTSWLLSVQLGTLNADFNGDLAVNSNDISAFLTAWLDAVQGGC